MFKILSVLLLLTVPAILAGFEDLNLGETKEKLQDILNLDNDDFMDIAPAALNCDLSYACFNGRHYYFETKTKRTRDDAAKFCRNINMSLLSVDDCAEDAFVTNAIKDNDCYKNNFWTSGYRTDTDIWYWSDGTVVQKFKNWMRGMPNFAKNAYCMAYASGYVQWTDLPCANKYYFVCESNNKCT